MYNQMMAFIAVVEEQSFTKAADKLAVTTTAVSKLIKQLEARLGQQLLQRHTRQVIVTETGQQFYAHCKRIAHEMASAENFIQAQQGKPRGKLRVLSSLVFANSHLIQHLQEFRQRYPDIQVEIDIGDRIPDMEREKFDIIVGFRLLPQIDPHLRQRKLVTTRYVLCASQDYLNRHGIPKTPEDLKQHKLINHSLRQPINLIRFQNGTEVYMDHPEIIINSMSALISLACQGAGILWSCEMEVAELFKTKKLIRVLPNYPMEEISAHLFYRHTEYEQRKIRCFIDFFVEKITAEPYDKSKQS